MSLGALLSIILAGFSSNVALSTVILSRYYEYFTNTKSCITRSTCCHISQLLLNTVWIFTKVASDFLTAVKQHYSENLTDIL